LDFVDEAIIIPVPDDLGFYCSRGKQEEDEDEIEIQIVRDFYEHTDFLLDHCAVEQNESDSFIGEFA